MKTWENVPVVVRASHGTRMRERSALCRQIEVFAAPFIVESTPGGESSRRQLLRALQTCHGAEFAVLLEDDAYLSPDFHERAISFIHRGTNMKPRDGIAYIPAGKFSMTVGIIIAVKMVIGLVNYLPLWERENPRHANAADYLLRDFCKRERLPVAIAWPSIVQHRDGVSALGHRTKNRISPSFLSAYGEVEPC